MTFDRLKSGLAAFVQSVFPRMDYLALYPATVVAQHGGNSIDVQPDNQRIPGQSGIPIYMGLPQVVVNVTPGARVLVGFAEGDPSKPYVAGWASGATDIELDLNAILIKLNNGSLPIARVTDTAGPYPIVGGNLTVLG